ncbi:hypothetical protein GCM10023153_24700 [Ornithinibacter aureus]|uniref:DUF3560 domain-containing protein n=1 Tax=Ornithinibacter aureus TaxID=622664 RepID=A0ABP8K0W4_9MICO|nr:hypothetical protein [Ornithinibacter aureus]KAF0833080.1 hypothetical protein C8E84_0852 [Ornithinibacter aureus]
MEEHENENALAGVRVRTGYGHGSHEQVDTVESVAREMGWHDDAAGDAPARLTGSPAPGRDRIESHFRRQAIREAASRPEAHLVGTPAAVAQAWEAVEAALGDYEQGRKDRAQVDHDERHEAAKDASRVRLAVAAGKAVKAIKGARDYDAERRHADAVLAGLWDRVNDARSRYDAAVEQALPDWSAAVLAEVSTAHAAALKAAHAARATLERLAVTVEAAQTLGVAADPEARSASPWTRHKADDGMSTVIAELGRDSWKRVETGAVLDRRINGLSYGMRVTIAKRVLSDTGRHAQSEWLNLLALEQREGYRYTRNGYPVTVERAT